MEHKCLNKIFSHRINRREQKLLEATMHLQVSLKTLYTKELPCSWANLYFNVAYSIQWERRNPHQEKDNSQLPGYQRSNGRTLAFSYIRVSSSSLVTAKPQEGFLSPLHPVLNNPQNWNHRVPGHIQSKHALVKDFLNVTQEHQARFKTPKKWGYEQST